MSASGGSRTCCSLAVCVQNGGMSRFLYALFLISLLSGCKEATYRDCPNERAGWQRPSDGPLGLTITNVIRVQSNAQLLWNDKAVTEKQLVQYLSFMRRMNPTPLTILTADEQVSCQAVEKIRTEMERRIGCKDGRCGEGENWR
jgi:hypothetical protein